MEVCTLLSYSVPVDELAVDEMRIHNTDNIFLPAAALQLSLTKEDLCFILYDERVLQLFINS